MRQPINNHRVSRDTQKPEKSTACCDFSLKTPHIGGGLVGGGCLFASFSAPEKVRDMRFSGLVLKNVFASF